MPRAKATEKFYVVPTSIKRRNLGKRLVGVNPLYKGDRSASLQDLIDFLKEQGIDPNGITLPSHFTLFIAE